MKLGGAEGRPQDRQGPYLLVLVAGITEGYAESNPASDCAFQVREPGADWSQLPSAGGATRSPTLLNRVQLPSHYPEPPTLRAPSKSCTPLWRPARSGIRERSFCA